MTACGCSAASPVHCSKNFAEVVAANAAADRLVAGVDGNLTYWAVSDLAAPELEEFARAFRAGEAEP